MTSTSRVLLVTVIICATLIDGCFGRDGQQTNRHRHRHRHPVEATVTRDTESCSYVVNIPAPEVPCQHFEYTREMESMKERVRNLEARLMELVNGKHVIPAQANYHQHDYSSEEYSSSADEGPPTRQGPGRGCDTNVSGRDKPDLPEVFIPQHPMPPLREVTPMQPNLPNVPLASPPTGKPSQQDMVATHHTMVPLGHDEEDDGKEARNSSTTSVIEIDEGGEDSIPYALGPPGAGEDAGNQASVATGDATIGPGPDGPGGTANDSSPLHTTGHHSLWDSSHHASLGNQGDNQDGHRFSGDNLGQSPDGNQDTSPDPIKGSQKWHQYNSATIVDPTHSNQTDNQGTHEISGSLTVLHGNGSNDEDQGNDDAILESLMHQDTENQGNTNVDDVGVDQPTAGAREVQDIMGIQIQDSEIGSPQVTERTIDSNPSIQTASLLSTTSPGNVEFSISSSDIPPGVDDINSHLDVSNDNQGNSDGNPMTSDNDAENTAPEYSPEPGNGPIAFAPTASQTDKSSTTTLQGGYSSLIFSSSDGFDDGESVNFGPTQGQDVSRTTDGGKGDQTTEGQENKGTTSGGSKVMRPFMRNMTSQAGHGGVLKKPKWKNFKERMDLKTLRNALIMGGGDTKKPRKRGMGRHNDCIVDVCLCLRKKGHTKSGVYYMANPEGSGRRGNHIRLFCDMATDGGGWTVVQRRQNGTTNFYREWDDYAKGFGRLDSDFWIGNYMLHAITAQTTFMLRVEFTDWNDKIGYAEYDSFKINDDTDNFRLLLGYYLGGNSGDSLSYHNNSQFSTRDRDNDISSGSCAFLRQAGFWFKACNKANPNGRWLGQADARGLNGAVVTWGTWEGRKYTYCLKSFRMMIRSQNLLSALTARPQHRSRGLGGHPVDSPHARFHRGSR